MKLLLPLISCLKACQTWPVVIWFSENFRADDDYIKLIYNYWLLNPVNGVSCAFISLWHFGFCWIILPISVFFNKLSWFILGCLLHANLVSCELLQDMLQTGMIVGGWDKYEGGKIYGIPLGGTIMEQPFSIGGIFLSRAILFYQLVFLLMAWWKWLDNRHRYFWY